MSRCRFLSLPHCRIHIANTLFGLRTNTLAHTHTHINTCTRTPRTQMHDILCVVSVLTVSKCCKCWVHFWGIVYLIESSILRPLVLLESTLRFFTTGWLAGDLLLPNSVSDEISVKFDVVNFCPKTFTPLDELARSQMEMFLFHKTGFYFWCDLRSIS